MRSRDVTSKAMDGITDLVVVAPIRDDFITAYENVTYATRLKAVAEALNRVRVSAREHERITPFSDVTERILTLLDFRVGIIDKDLFALRPGSAKGPRAQRFLYLTATFDGAWEPYMRLIWQPLGPFLDLLFCNCDGYVTATDHSFEEYAQWVRDNQMDSAIFYAATGITVRDIGYLTHVERLQRAGAGPVELAQATMPDPEAAAAATRSNPAYLKKVLELGLEALTVLYKLADFYPPEWLTGHPDMNEGRLLAQVARDLLLGWEPLVAFMDAQPPASELGKRWALARQVYAEPLGWYESGKAHLARLEAARVAARLPDPAFDRAEVQAGILKARTPDKAPVRAGALLLFTVRDGDAARRFIAGLPVNFAGGDGAESADGFFRTIAFTPEGLRQLGLEPEVIDHFPKEFREGMAARSGLIGDMRENHPRNWILPPRNGPGLLDPALASGAPLPPVELAEVDFIIQLRTADADEAALLAEVRRLALAAAPAATLEAYDLMQSSLWGDDGTFRDHLGFRDGVSQPRPDLPDQPATGRDRVAPGEILLGYGNDRWDAAPGDFASFPPDRQAARRRMLALTRNGTFMVVRKIEERVDAFAAFLEQACATINRDHGAALAAPMTPDGLRGFLLGRGYDGTPPLPTGPGGINDFDYAADPQGLACPHASHIRRANPRDMFQGRPAPRILRRGMSFADGKGAKGLMFVCYNASIAEQYETIQRWLNGGNSTHISSQHNDPLTGVMGKDGAGVFRFLVPGKTGPLAISLPLPPVTQDAPGRDGEPGRHPFTPLHWGLYAFVPSRAGLKALAALTGRPLPLRDLHELRGDAVIARIDALEAEEQGREWKRVLEDFEAKDPSERAITPDIWDAIRHHKGGSLDLKGGVPSSLPDRTDPQWQDQPTILSASRAHVLQVLADYRKFSSEEQLRRIAGNAGPIYVAQQPDDRYGNRALDRLGLDYAAEAEATNAVLMAHGEEDGFRAGHAAGRAVLDMARTAAAAGGRDYFKIELRRQFLLPALGALCRHWYGLPDGVTMEAGGWTWQPAFAPGPDGQPAPARKARCPGDFLSPSRNAFYPRPTDTVERFAEDQGRAIAHAAKAFVERHWHNRGADTGTIARQLFTAIDDKDVLARNLIGTMVGAIPPMDGHLRGVLLEWLSEQSLWRIQASLHRATGNRAATADFAAARAVLFSPVSQAMCKRPAPDLLYRTAKDSAKLKAAKGPGCPHAADVKVERGDLVIASLASATQASLLDPATPDGELSLVFGGKRKAPLQRDSRDHEHPPHACPAQPLATGAIMGIMASLLDAGRIQALPASLIVKVSDWR